MGVVLGITFFVLIVPLIVVLIFTYLKNKKIYPLMFIVSIFTYINMVSYVIDAFQLKKNGIIIILGLSAVIMILAGLYIDRKNRARKR